MTPYELLGVERGADIEDIKRAYRTLAKELHPDVNAGDGGAAERFKEITAAYNLLADRRKRKEYDRNSPDKGSEDGVQPWQKGGAWFDFEIDESTGERTVDLFGDVAGTRLGRVKGAAATSLWMKGQDIAETLKIVQSEADDGICKLITTMTGITVAVDIPAQTNDGDIVTLRGFGIEGFGGGPPGDLNIIVSIVPDPAIGETEHGSD
jgi:curved DNA-binding protein